MDYTEVQEMLNGLMLTVLKRRAEHLRKQLDFKLQCLYYCNHSKKWDKLRKEARLLLDELMKLQEQIDRKEQKING